MSLKSVMLNYDEQCTEGYTGNLCHRCDQGFGRQGENQCVACPTTMALTYTYMFGQFIGVCATCVWMIHSTMKSAGEAASLTSQMQKIFMSYAQLVGLASNFQLSWPGDVQNMFQAQTSLSNIGNSLINMDCVVQGAVTAENSTTLSTDIMPLSYQKTVAYMFLPIACLVVPAVSEKSIKYLHIRNRNIRFRNIFLIKYFCFYYFKIYSCGLCLGTRWIILSSRPPGI